MLKGCERVQQCSHDLFLCLLIFPVISNQLDRLSLRLWKLAATGTMTPSLVLAAQTRRSTGGSWRMTQVQVRARDYLGKTFRKPLPTTAPFSSFTPPNLVSSFFRLYFLSTNEFDGRRWLRGLKGSFKADIRYECSCSFLNTLVPRLEGKKDFKV